MKRILYLASYDVINPSRLAKALRLLKDYATGGQYSFFECPLTENEHNQLINRMAQLLKEDDSFFLIELDSR
jgi:CRISPR-associated protein Cas2